MRRQQRSSPPSRGRPLPRLRSGSLRSEWGRQTSCAQELRSDSEFACVVARYIRTWKSPARPGPKSDYAELRPNPRSGRSRRAIGQSTHPRFQRTARGRIHSRPSRSVRRRWRWCRPSSDRHRPLATVRTRAAPARGRGSLEEAHAKAVRRDARPRGPQRRVGATSDLGSRLQPFGGRQTTVSSPSRVRRENARVARPQLAHRTNSGSARIAPSGSKSRMRWCSASDRNPSGRSSAKRPGTYRCQISSDLAGVRSIRALGARSQRS
jgi:hypothetical protein